jgi:hypothetical protein
MVAEARRRSSSITRHEPREPLSCDLERPRQLVPGTGALSDRGVDQRDVDAAGPKLPPQPGRSDPPGAYPRFHPGAGEGSVVHVAARF